MTGKVIEELVERLHEVFKRATGKPLPGIEMGHDVVREQGFNGSLYVREFRTQGKEGILVPQGRNRYPRGLPGVAG